MRYWQTKDDVILEDLFIMHPDMVRMIAYTNKWCNNKGIQPYWTSFISDRSNVNAKSSTHGDGRGADLSLLACFGWTTDLIDEYQQDMIVMFGSIGALIRENGELVSRPVYPHGEGKALHAHLQCRPS